VINVSPESPKRTSVVSGVAGALRLARRHQSQGAAIMDVGGRSSSPSSPLVSDDEERGRALPVVRALSDAGWVVSIDTWSTATAMEAMDAGAGMVNFTGSEPGAELIAMLQRCGRRLCLTYNPYGDPYRMRTAAPVLPEMDEIIEFFIQRLDLLPARQLVLDPNIGMLHQHIRSDRSLALAWRWRMLSRVHELVALGRPVMLALPSRDGPRTTELWASIIASTGASYVRTHHPALVTKVLTLSRK
jgi:dihydropteroate synthase